MEVNILASTPNPIKVLVYAIRTCYQSHDKQSEQSDINLVKHIVKNDESPLEFIDFTFEISGISRACSHQLVRHRVASYSQKSQRYCKETNFEYVIPPLIANDNVARFAYKSVMKDLQKSYDYLISLGVKKEDARFVLPNACETTIIAKFNLRSLRHFLKLRTGPRAQWEIAELATKMLSQVEAIEPLFIDGIL